MDPTAELCGDLNDDAVATAAIEASEVRIAELERLAGKQPLNMKV